MCHAVKFLSLIITCIIITDGVLCHEEWKRQSNGTESEPTTTTANSTTAARRQITFVNTGVPIIVAILGSITAAIAALTSWCLCTKQDKRKEWESISKGGCRECLKNNMWIIMFIIAILSLLVSVTGVIISATR